MPELPLPDKVLALAQGLAEAKIAFAFGGALALAYYAEPRTTVDIDVNVFIGPDRHSEVDRVLEELGAQRLSPTLVERDSQARTWWGRTPVDVFFAYDPVHDAMRRDARLVPFGGDRIPVLAPEHLVVAKTIFDRPKDSLDIEQMLVSVANLDLGEIRRWLLHLVAPDDPRRARFDATVRRVLGAL